EELSELLKNEKKIFIAVCKGCAEVCNTSDAAAVEKRKKELVEMGKEVTGCVEMEFLCNRALVSLRFLRAKEQIDACDAVLVLSCGIGVQAVSAVSGKPTYPSDNTISMEGVQGLWPGDERCAQCGDCLLGYTGGICPFTACSKGLTNGQCGGAKDGICEVQKGKECGWQKIYERLKSTGRLDNLKDIKVGRKFSNMIVEEKDRKSLLYSLDNTGVEE
ncbi:MAG: methylenetetrahydrofolate reductase C-terminal domain-containing protein, partial [Candidatus Omnitrophota bacterium]